MQGVQSVRCYQAANLTSHLLQIALTPRTTCNFLSGAEICMKLRLIATGWLESVKLSMLLT